MNPRPDYPLNTERLLIRPYRPGDLDDVLDFQSDPDVVRYVPWPVRNREETRGWLSEAMTHQELSEAGQWLQLAAELRDTGRVVGGLMFKWISSANRDGEIGFAFHRDVQRQGLGREAARALLRYGFETMQLHRIIGICDARNHASVALMTSVGMRQEAHLRQSEFFKGQWTDELIFARLRSEWP